MYKYIYLIPYTYIYTGIYIPVILIYMCTQCVFVDVHSNMWNEMARSESEHSKRVFSATSASKKKKDLGYLLTVRVVVLSYFDVKKILYRFFDRQNSPFFFFF